MAKHWFIAYLTSHYSSEKNLGLDLGSGNRNWQEFFNCKMIGVDLPEKLNNEKKLRPDVCGTAISLPFKNNSFDFLSCYTVLSYVAPLNSALDEIYRVLKPKAVAVIIYVNQRGMNQHDDVNWINKLSPKYMDKKLAEHGLKSIKHKNLKALFYSNYFNLTSVYGFSIVKSKKVIQNDQY